MSEPPDLETLARRYLDLWQDQVTALAVDPEAFTAAVGREIRRRLDEFATGLTRYRHHAYRRTLRDAPSVWRAGTTTLRDYGSITAAAEVGRPVLVVPSLINRAYVLDL